MILWQVIAAISALACWEFGKGRRSLHEVTKQVRASIDLAEEIAENVCRAFNSQNNESQSHATKAPPSGVGETGLAVAAIRAEESHRPDRLFNDALAGSFVAASKWTSKRPKWDLRSRTLKFWIIARTVFFDELILDACQTGCQQVVILGAGFDTRAFRLVWPSNIRCFEVDTAKVFDFKTEVLEQQNATARCARIPIPCDLREDWPSALMAAGFDPVNPSVWLAEGLVMYLDADQVDRLLRDISRLAAPRSRFGADMSTRKPNLDEKSHYMDLWRSSAPEEPVSWLLTYGWSAEISKPREILRAHGRLGEDKVDPSKEAAAPDRTHKSFLIGAVKG